MYKVLIVDDEELIRNGLSKFIPWAQLGFEIAGLFGDGAPVIDYLKHNCADLIIADIKMTSVSGLDIAKFVYENQLHTKICILSGYKDFEYARTAMKYNVNWYLTKPNDIDETIEIVKEIKQHVDDSYRLLKREEEYSKVLSIAAQQFFADIFLGNYEDINQILNRMQYLNLNENTVYCPIWVTTENYDDYIKNRWKYGKEYFINAVCNFLNDSLESFSIHKVMVTGNELLLIAYSDKKVHTSQFKNELQQHMDTAKENIRCMLSLNIHYKMGIIFNNITEFINYVSKSLWIDAPTDTKHIQNIIDEKSYALLLEKYKNLILCIITGRNKQAYSNFKDITTLLATLKFEDTIGFIKDLFYIIFNKLSEFTGKNIAEFFTESMDKLTNSCDNCEIVKQSLEIFSQLLSFVDSKNFDNSASIIINKAKKFIQDNYATDISLEDVANYVFLNSVYFSKFFKQHTGENFSDYLINLRIKKSIELLSEGKYKIYEVGELVGYRNSKYFSRQFKQITGMSPSEYINS